MWKRLRRWWQGDTKTERTQTMAEEALPVGAMADLSSESSGLQLQGSVAGAQIPLQRYPPNLLHRLGCRCATLMLKREEQEGREVDPRSWAAIRAKEAWLQDRLSTTALEEAEAAALHAAQAAYAKAMFPGASDADRRRAHAARAANWAACDIAHRRALESFTRDIFRITLAEEVLSKETLEALIQSMVRPLEQARRGLVFVLLQRKHQAQPQPLYPLHKGFEDALFDEA